MSNTLSQLFGNSTPPTCLRQSEVKGGKFAVSGENSEIKPAYLKKKHKETPQFCLVWVA